jgi:streptogramin lyase
MMAFRVFPAGAAPLKVPAGSQSNPQGFQELAGIVDGDLTMFLRLVKLGGGCAPPGGPDPAIRLSAGGGPAVQVAMFPDAASVHDGQGNFVADALCEPRGDGVYRVRVFIARPGSAWQLQLGNQDAQARGFTWVVADNDQETRQPWIDLPPMVSFEAVIGQQVTSSVRVANLGTGPLTISDPKDFEPGPGFKLTTVPGPIKANDCGELQVSFTLVDPGAPLSAVYTATSDDTTAQQTPGHNRRVTLTATRRLPPGTIITLEVNEADDIELFQIDPRSGVRTKVDFSAEALRPRTVTVAPDGGILVAGRQPVEDVGAVVRVDPNTGQQVRVCSAQMLVRPAGIVVEADGTILVADEDGFGGKGGLIRINPSTGDQSSLAVGGSVFKSPVAVAVTAESILVLARTLGGDYGLFRVDPRTGVPRALSALASRRTFGLAVQADGRVLVAKYAQDAGGSVVRVKPVAGQQDTLTASESLHAVGLVVEQDGHILIADDGLAGTGGVLRLDPGGGQPTVLSASTFHGPHAIAVVPPAGG